jgi:hypothetical protein
LFKGSNWGALLVAGDDDNPGKAAVMKKEILELERLVTSQAPRIIGIRYLEIYFFLYLTSYLITFLFGIQ